MSGLRIAKVAIRGSDTMETVSAYLPSNYRVLGKQGDDILICGIDNHGWTMDGYVIPRLASGMMIATEFELDLDSILKYDPLNLLSDSSEVMK